MKLFDNPKNLSNEQLWFVMQNVFPDKDGCPLELKNWYKKVEDEFLKRDVKLRFIISALPSKECIK